MQVFFIPAAVGRLRLRGLPLSNELASVLRKLGIWTFDDLAGVSLRDFRRVSDHGSAMFLEVGQLIERARQGEFAVLPAQSGGLQSASTPPHSPGLPGRSVRRSRRAPTSAIETQRSQERPHDEIISIPEEVQGEPLTAFPAPIWLQNLLKRHQLVVAGDLQGRRFSEFIHYPHSGKEILLGLGELLEAIQQGCRVPTPGNPPTVGVPPRSQLSVSRVFLVRPELHDVSLSDVPLSFRLEGVLKEKGVRRLGDLDGVAVRDVYKMRHCGWKTIAELNRLIERAGAGELHTEPAPWNPAELVRTLDALIADLPPPGQEMLALRLGGQGDEALTFELIGTRFHLTRERVRQLVHRNVERIRRTGSRRLASYLQHLDNLCREKVCPLTPALLQRWLENPPASARFGSPFYLRLVAALKPTIPIWLGGHEAAGHRRRREQIEHRLCAVLRRRLCPLGLPQALTQVRTKAGFRQVEPIEFLETLQHSRRLKVQFPQPDEPVVRLAQPSPTDVAKAVLQASATPLRPEAILARAKRRFGPELARWAPHVLHRQLVEARGFYLLGRGAYGLRRHFALPETKWEQIQADFRRFLKRAGCPVSTFAIVRFQRFRWTHETGPHELACILRRDDRLIDLGRFVFALAEWAK